MKPSVRPAGDMQPESIDFVPKRVLDQAEQQIHRQQREVERLRKELEAALRASRRQAAPIRVAHLNATRRSQGASRVAAMADRHAGRFRHGWMNGSRFHCRSTARIAAVAWSGKATQPSIRKRLSGAL